MQQPNLVVIPAEIQTARIGEKWAEIEPLAFRTQATQPNVRSLGQGAFVFNQIEGRDIFAHIPGGAKLAGAFRRRQPLLRHKTNDDATRARRRAQRVSPTFAGLDR